METFLGKMLGDMANLVGQKWYAGMGFSGLVILVWVLLKGTPHDDFLVGAIGAAMMGFGFGEAEMRTFRQLVDPHLRFKITGPARKVSVAGVLLYLLGIASAAAAMLRAVGWI